MYLKIIQYGDEGFFCEGRLMNRHNDIKLTANYFFATTK
jgi:hypothetical protein